MSLKPSPRLPLNTAEELFEKLKTDESRLAESWSISDTTNFIVTAHHLYVDWILQGKAATTEQTARAVALPTDAKSVFQVVIDVSNGTKHWELTNPRSVDRQVVTEVTPPICAGWDSYFWGDMVYFRFEEYFVSIGELSALVMRYFEWIIYGTSSKTLNELSSALAAMKVTPQP